MIWRKGLVVFLYLVAFAGNAYSQLSFSEPSQEQMVMNNLSSMPLTFTENHGQWNDKALFKADAGGATFWFCGDEIVYVFTRDTDELLDRDMLINPDMADKFEKPRYKKESIVIKAQFLGAKLNAEVIGEDRLSHNCNYFYGNEPSKWRTDVPNYSSIIYKDVWPGIDLNYHGNGKGMKYDFIVNPGADISQIQINYEGVDNLAITHNGDLEAETRFGAIHENIPSIYQEIGGNKREVTGRYVITAPGVFGFEVDDYNPSLTLVIDPELVYSTYLGGSLEDFGYGVALDASGCAYVTGYTYSSDFPTANPYDGSYNGVYYDVFVTKFSSEGNSLVYSTYIGGFLQDCGYGIAVDDSANAYVTGYTSSLDFPTANPYDNSHNGNNDVFVTKLSSSGNSLVYSTYLGGSVSDNGYGIAVDGGGNAYVTGSVYSSDFPTANPYDGSYNGSDDVFVTKLSPSGNSLVYSTFIGGVAAEYGLGIAVDDGSNAYVTGFARGGDFPTANPYDGSHNGYDDVFVTKLSPAGNTLVYSTYLGGSSFDNGYGIAVDGSGNAYVTGRTGSLYFPTQNPYDGSINGVTDAFVTKLSPAGNSLVYSTYIGGSGDDEGRGIAIDATGNVYVTGFTTSTNFPTANPYDDSFNGGVNDVFVTELSSAGNSLIYSTYLGGDVLDEGRGIAVDASGSFYVAGRTLSSSFPTQNPFDGSLNYTDAFVTKFDQSTGIEEDESNMPHAYRLHQNYPNPFNASTIIYYELLKSSWVTIDIYDLLGRKLTTLVNSRQTAGTHQAIWNADGATSGVYFYRILTDDYTNSCKMLLIK